MNEELQSTNDEFQTINEELQDRSAELDSVNYFIESVLTSLRSGVVVVDRDLRITIWNHPTEELWGVRQQEAIGAHLLSLDIGLPVDRLRPALRNVLAGGADETLSVEAVDRRGRAVTVRVAVSPLGEGDRVAGAVLVLTT
jgi:two-component system CheB/CheR fusion protein